MAKGSLEILGGFVAIICWLLLYQIFYNQLDRNCSPPYMNESRYLSDVIYGNAVYVYNSLSLLDQVARGEVSA